MNTILYLTDSSLDPEILDLCQRVLIREAGDTPIISVSQEPIDFGENVCVGKIGRSWKSLYTQMLAGLEKITTDWAVIAEHDVLYTSEHLHHEPDDKDVFWYNANCWLVVGPGGNHPELYGMYSYWPKRYALSQLIAPRQLLHDSTTEILGLIDAGLKLERGMRWYGEPGVVEGKLKRAAIAACSGRPTQLQQYLRDYVTRYGNKVFKTRLPNVDIRHGSNFTGPKRGKKRRYEIPYWGRFDELLKENRVRLADSAMGTDKDMVRDWTSGD